VQFSAGGRSLKVDRYLMQA